MEEFKYLGVLFICKELKVELLLLRIGRNQLRGLRHLVRRFLRRCFRHGQLRGGLGADQSTLERQCKKWWKWLGREGFPAKGTAAP